MNPAFPNDPITWRMLVTHRSSLTEDGVGDVPYRPVKLFNYVVNQTPETIVLLRSLIVDLINFSEKVSPVFTPKDVVDNQPVMKMIQL